jgi:hypothetical protein
MKKILLLLFLIPLVLYQHAFTQVKWTNDTIPPSGRQWDNYSTSYLGDVSDSIPFIVVAIPYNGSNSNFGDMNAPLDLSFKGSLFRFKSGLLEKGRKLYTYDSSDVYFLTPGIYKKNADKYEFRVTLNAQHVVTPWTTVDRFTDLDLNEFKEGYGFLGGYKTTWGNYLAVELRKKGASKNLSSAIVYWKETQPEVAAIFTNKNLNDFFTVIKRPWDKKIPSAYKIKNTVFPSPENTIIYLLSADVFKKEAIEYQLVKDEKVFRTWGYNDYDNNFIWLKDLSPGKYRLQIRYSKQRQHVSEYDFEIEPAWHQTAGFKIIAGSLIAAFFGFIVLLFRYRKVKAAAIKDRLAKEKLDLELQSVYARLNPHFIFNALSSIQALINKNDNDAANRYLSEFAILLRNPLTNSKKEFNSLENELDALQKYLSLEQLRFRFNYQVQVDEHINTFETTIPYLLLQPLLENAVKHGVAGMQEEGNIQLHINKLGNDMQVLIRDNGKGFGSSHKKEGQGLQITQERIRLLNKTMKEKPVELTIAGKETGDTIIAILFKNWFA